MLIQLTPPTETGGAELFRYRIRVTISGRGSRYVFVDAPSTPGSFYENLEAKIKTAFSLTTLPTGLYTFEAQVRNTQSPAYGPVGDHSRCSINHLNTADLPHKVSNIRFSKANNKLIVTYTEPTHTGAYTFLLSLIVSDLNLGTTYLRSNNLSNTKTNPNGVDATFEIDLTADQFANIFVNKRIVARIRSSVSIGGEVYFNSLTKTQVYQVAAVQIPNAPHLDSARLDSDNNLIVQFDYPSGSQPITRFHVAILEPERYDESILYITNTFSPNQKNIRVNAGRFPYSAPGEYLISMHSENSAGTSFSSNVESVNLAAPPPPPPPPQRPNAPRIISVTNRGGVVYLRFRYPTGTQPVTSFKMYAGTSQSSLSLKRTINAPSVRPSSGIAEYRVSTTERYNTPGTTYYFAMRATNSVGDSDQSNVRSITIARPQTRPNAPNVRSVSRDSNNNARIVFDYPRTGPSITQFKIYEVVSGVAHLRRTLSAASYVRGQTSISTYVDNSITYSSPGTYNFLMRASNASGDSPNSNRVSFTIRRPVTPTNPMPHFIYSRVEGISPRGFELTVARTTRAWPSNFVSRSALFYVDYVRNARTDVIAMRNFFPGGSRAVNSPTGAAFSFEGEVAITESSTLIRCTKGINQLNLFRLSKFFNFEIAINYQVYSSNRQAGSSIFFADSSTFDPLVDTAPSQLFRTASFDPEYVYASAPSTDTITDSSFPLNQDYTVDFTPGQRALGWRLNIFDNIGRNVTDSILNTASEKYKYTGFVGVTGTQRLSFRRNPSIDILHAANLALGRYQISLTSFNFRGQTESAKVATKR